MLFPDLGSQFSLSFVSGAALLADSDANEATVLTQFKAIFRRGFVLCPPFAAISTLANLGNAFICWRSIDCDHAGVALRYVLAGLCTASLIPFTLMFVVRSEGLLLEKSAGRTEDGKAKTLSSAAGTRGLVEDWARLNYMRTLFPLLGALLSYSVC